MNVFNNDSETSTFPKWFPTMSRGRIIGDIEMNVGVLSMNKIGATTK